MILKRCFFVIVLLAFLGCKKKQESQDFSKAKNSTFLNEHILHYPLAKDGFSYFEYYEMMDLNITDLRIEKIDSVLRKMHDWDQKYRGEAFHNLNENTVEDLKKKVEFIRKRKTIDSINFLLLEKITEKIGWPDKKVYSEKAINGAFLTILHTNGKNDFEPQVFEPYIENALRTSQITNYHYAVLIDHFRISGKLKQKFGTHCRNIDGRIEFYNMEEITAINKNRKSIGLPLLKKESCELISY